MRIAPDPRSLARCEVAGLGSYCLACVLADDRAAIEAFLKQTADANSVDLILTTGGTGLGPRDVTPEATMAVCERLIPGFPEQMRAAGVKKMPRAILSRAVAGIRGKTIIVNLPGSPKGAVESLDAIAGTAAARGGGASRREARVEKGEPIKWLRAIHRRGKDPAEQRDRWRVAFELPFMLVGPVVLGGAIGYLSGSLAAHQATACSSCLEFWAWWSAWGRGEERGRARQKAVNYVRI